MKKSIVSLVLLLTLSFNLKAQSGLEAIITAAEDTEKLAGAYLAPGMEALINGMNGGWYHTAKVHKTLGIDLSIGLNATLIPASKETFQFASLGLTNSTSNSATGATLGGSGDLNPTVTYTGTVNGQSVTSSFEMPGGIKDDVPFAAIPAPAIQLGIGLPFKADVLLRFVPKIGTDDVKGDMFGIGLKKEITGLLGPLDKLPLHISLLGAYTSMNVDYNLQAESTIAGSNQKAEFGLTSYTVQAIASLNFPFINFYGGFGYGSGTANLNMLGTYTINYDLPNGLPLSNTINDPLQMEFESSGFRSTVGARISLGFLKIFADYTFQEYNTLNAGIALSFR